MAEAVAAFAVALCAGLLWLLAVASRRIAEAEEMAQQAALYRDIANAKATELQEKYDEQRAMTNRALNSAIQLAKRLHRQEMN